MMRKHIEILAYLNIVLGAITAFGGLVLAFVVAGSGLISGDETAMWVTSLIGGGLGFFIAAMGAVSILGGWGLLKRQEWARILIIILSILSLPAFPVGTALGAYGLWVLFSEEAKLEFNSHIQAGKSQGI
ncbi:hypothetical protein [Catalinimonas niigatensis]|uniref:hypothetical protein n=1 Tax=Catalinimonas niigatensis TaxID=1397264 RepID=UPI0026651132|nr:hypothetical protein [Catalinimonas niigatensis]WPP50008.1 hypothetical protein PZB72_25420 [Catalinimonas niigatensis]